MVFPTVPLFCIHLGQNPLCFSTSVAFVVYNGLFPIRLRSAASLLLRPSNSRSTTGSWLRSSRSASSGQWSSPAPEVRNCT